MPKPIRRNGVTLDTPAPQRGVEHEVVERNQDHHERGVQRLHLRATKNHSGFTHLVRLQDPRRRLLIEQRQERRHQREHDEDAQHRTHAFDRVARDAPRSRDRAAARRRRRRTPAGTRGARQAEATKPSDPIIANAADRERRADGGDDEARASLPFAARPERCTRDAQERVRVRGAGGTFTYFLRPAQNTTVAMNISDAGDAERDRTARSCAGRSA